MVYGIICKSENQWKTSTYFFSQEDVFTVPIRQGTNFEEQIPIRRVWLYPLYNAGVSEYEYDIAVIELGTRHIHFHN